MSHDTILHRAIRPAVRRLARTRVTPNHLTMLRFATGLLAAVAFAQGEEFWVDVGAGIFLVSAFLDRADGAAGSMAFVALGLGATDGPLGFLAAILGLSAGGGIAALFWQINVQDLGFLPQYVSGSGRVLVDPDDMMLTVPVLLWCFGAEPVVVATGTIPPVIAIWKALSHRRRGAPSFLQRRSDTRAG